jgi:predicted dehydrogenase
VAAVDISPAVLDNTRQHLGLRPDQCYTDLQQACDAVRADFWTIVVPPAFHERTVDIALAHDLHILSEKPIADTLEASERIVAKAHGAGKKMGVTMSHRFDQDKTTLRRELQSGNYGALDYFVC